MTKKIALKSLSRKKVEKNNKEIRRTGFVPGVLYGAGTDNITLKVKAVDLEKVFKEAGESTLVDLQIDDKPATKIIIKDVQIDSLKDTIRHVDFYQVDMTKTIEVEIPFEFINESGAEKEHGAMIMKNIASVLVKCLPGDLVENIEVDMSKLQNIGDVIRISDLELPKSFELMSDLNEAIISATEHKIEEEAPIVTEESEETEEEKTDGETEEAKEGEKVTEEKKQ